jgi:hypothetical protein
MPQSRPEPNESIGLERLAAREQGETVEIGRCGGDHRQRPLTRRETRNEARHRPTGQYMGRQVHVEDAP